MAIRKVLITGAGGRLGTALRARLAGRFDLLRLTDLVAQESAGPREEVIQCDLSDYHCVKSLCRGMDAVIHLGAYPREARWETLISRNIVATTNVYECARKCGVDRVLFASSIAVTGFYRVGVVLDHTTPPRPDGRYGVTKSFGENLAMLCAYKHALRSFVMRLGACRPEPTDSSLLPIWLSYDDLARLVMVGLTADYRFEIVYGLSRSSRACVDNQNAFRLGYKPLDSADDYVDRVAHSSPASEVDALFQGAFASTAYSGSVDWVP
jgi:uronate dehydrogenase